MLVRAPLRAECRCRRSLNLYGCPGREDRPPPCPPGPRSRHWAVFPKVKHSLSTKSSNCAPRYLPKWGENLPLHENLPKDVCLLSRSVVSSSITPWTVAREVPLSMWFSRQEYWSGSHSLLQGRFPTQGSNAGLLDCVDIYSSSTHDRLIWIAAHLSSNRWMDEQTGSSRQWKSREK